MRDWKLEELFGNRIFLKDGAQKELFRVARQRMGWSKLQMAEYLGISDTAIYNYEREDPRRHPTWEIIEKVLTLVLELRKEILNSIYEVKPMHWGSQKGIGIVNTKYADQLSKWGRVGGRKSIRLMAERYPDKLQEWRRAAGRKGAQVLHTLYKDKFTEWGKKGVAAGIQKYPEKLREWARNGAKALAEKYHDKLSEWGKKGAAVLNTKYKDRTIEGAWKGHLNGGLRGAENQEPTKQMRWLIEQNKQLGIVEGIDFKVNCTIKNGDNFRNFDFVYFKDGEPKLIEEDTAALPHRHRVLEKAYQVISAKRWLSLVGHDVNYLFLLPLGGRDSRGYPIRVPPEVVLGLVEEGITPCFYDEEWLKFRKEIIQATFQGDYSNQDTCRYLDLYEWGFIEIRKRRSSALRCARSESNSEMDLFEAAVHENLRELGFEPEGKTIIESKVLSEKLGLRNSTYMVVDNSFIRDGKRWHVQVSVANTMNSFKCSADRHAGYFWLLKKWFDPQAGCLSIIFTGDGTFGLQKRDGLVAHRTFDDRTIYTKLGNLEDSLQMIFCKPVEHTSEGKINASAA